MASAASKVAHRWGAGVSVMSGEGQPEPGADGARPCTVLSRPRDPRPARQAAAEVILGSVPHQGSSTRASRTRGVVRESGSRANGWTNAKRSTSSLRGLVAGDRELPGARLIPGQHGLRREALQRVGAAVQVRAVDLDDDVVGDVVGPQVGDLDGKCVRLSMVGGLPRLGRVPHPPSAEVHSDFLRSGRINASVPEAHNLVRMMTFVPSKLNIGRTPAPPATSIAPLTGSPVWSRRGP